MHCIPTVTPSPLDLFEVTRLLKDMTRTEMTRLGVALGLSYVTLRRMNMFPEDIVTEWLRCKKDAVHKISDPPSWTSLAIALDKTGHSAIATKIRKGT